MRIIALIALLALIAGCSSTRGRFEYPSGYEWVFQEGRNRALACVGDDSRIKYATGFVHDPVEIRNAQGLMRNPAVPNDERLRPAWFVESYTGHIQIHVVIQYKPDGTVDYDAMIKSVTHEFVHGMSGERGHPKQFKPCAPNWRDS